MSTLPPEVLQRIMRLICDRHLEPEETSTSDAFVAQAERLRELAYSDLNNAALVSKAWARVATDVRFEHYVLVSDGEGEIGEVDARRLRERPDLLARVCTLLIIADAFGEERETRMTVPAERFAQACPALRRLATWGRTKRHFIAVSGAGMAPMLPRTVEAVIIGRGNNVMPVQLARITQLTTLVALSLAHVGILDYVDQHTATAIAQSCASIQHLRLDFQSHRVSNREVPLSTGEHLRGLAAIIMRSAAGTLRTLTLVAADPSGLARLLWSLDLPQGQLVNLTRLGLSGAGTAYYADATRACGEAIASALPQSLQSVQLVGGAEGEDVREDITSTLEAYQALTDGITARVEAGTLPHLVVLGLNGRYAYEAVAVDGETGALVREAVARQETLRAFCVERGIQLVE